jgi:hypothetical protein
LVPGNDIFSLNGIDCPETMVVSGDWRRAAKHGILRRVTTRPHSRPGQQGKM